jgi:hypothetical protein
MLMVGRVDRSVEPRSAGFPCERVHFSSGYGVCLSADRGFFTTYAAEIFNDRLERLHKLALAGAPSRTRVSPDGRLAGITVFVSGHSYAQAGFSTQTTIHETASGRQLAELEQFAVDRDGAPFREQDFNFWGVTFTKDSNRFYATLGTGGKIYLVSGDVAAQRLTVVREGIECPSLSPDNRKIAFKSRVPGPVLRWRVAVLDVATLQTQELSETRPVDDQVEWLDDNHILYSLAESQTVSSVRTDVWKLRVDGASAPELLMEQAYSPAVLRTSGMAFERASR